MQKNSGDSDFGPDSLPAGEGAALVERFVNENDFSPHTRRAFAHDLKSFAAWFVGVNREPFRPCRVTIRDVGDYRDHLWREKGRAVSSVNRALVAIRRFLAWLVEQGHMPANPALKVKELRRQLLAPKALDPAQVRRLLREVEVRGDVRAAAVFAVLLYTGCRVGELVRLDLADLGIGERGGAVVIRHGKGGKQRTVPLPLPARRALQTYLEVRPPVPTDRLFVGERGPLGESGVRNLAGKYGAICGIPIHPHKLRHTFATRFLHDTDNDLVSLAQILGHESLTTTARYTRRGADQLAEAAEKLTY